MPFGRRELSEQSYSGRPYKKNFKTSQGNCQHAGRLRLPPHQPQSTRLPQGKSYESFQVGAYGHRANVSPPKKSRIKKTQPPQSLSSGGRFFFMGKRAEKEGIPTEKKNQRLEKEKFKRKMENLKI